MGATGCPARGRGRGGRDRRRGMEEPRGDARGGGKSGRRGRAAGGEPASQPPRGAAARRGRPPPPRRRGRRWRGSRRRSHLGAPLPAAAGHLPLGAGDEVATEPGGRGEVVLADGVDIVLESETRLTLPDSSADPAAKTHEAVGLASGTVAVRVPPMAAGHTFSVRTPDAEVTVHGTSFTVEVVPPPTTGVGGAATRVRVTTGVVSVSAAGLDTVLTAGMEWSSPVGTRTSAAPTAAASTSPPPRRSEPSAVAAVAPATHSAARVPPSSLGEENR